MHIVSNLLHTKLLLVFSFIFFIFIAPIYYYIYIYIYIYTYIHYDNIIPFIYIEFICVIKYIDLNMKNVIACL